MDKFGARVRFFLPAVLPPDPNSSCKLLGPADLYRNIAMTLRTYRADRGCCASGMSMPRWGCAGCFYPSHSASRSPAMRWERGAWREQVGPIQPQAGSGRRLVWALFVRRTLTPHPACSDAKRASGCSHLTLSTAQPLPAYSRRRVSLQAARSLCHAVENANEPIRTATQ